MPFRYSCQCQCHQENFRVFWQQFAPHMPSNYEQQQQQQYGNAAQYALCQPFYPYPAPFMHNNDQQVFMAAPQQQQQCFNQSNRCTVQPRWV